MAVYFIKKCVARRLPLLLPSRVMRHEKSVDIWSNGKDFS